MKRYTLDKSYYSNFEIQGQSLDSLFVEYCHMRIIHLMYEERFI